MPGPNTARKYFHSLCFEISGDFLSFDAVLDVRPHPVLKRLSQLFIAVQQRDVCPGTEKLERGLGGGILTTNHDDIPLEVGMGFRVVVGYVRQVFSGYPQHVRVVVITDRKHDASRAICGGGRFNSEFVCFSTDFPHFFVLADVQALSLDDLSVVFQRLVPVGFFPFAHQGHVSDFQKLRRGEEGHLSRKMEDRICNAALVDNDVIQVESLGFDRSRQSRGSGADYEYIKKVEGFRHLIEIPLSFSGSGTGIDV